MVEEKGNHLLRLPASKSVDCTSPPQQTVWFAYYVNDYANTVRVETNNKRLALTPPETGIFQNRHRIREIYLLRVDNVTWIL